jgi:Right handed beta helix region
MINYLRLGAVVMVLLGLLAGCSRQPLTEILSPAAATIWVATTGSNTATCGASATPCATIAYAVGKVNALGATNAPGSQIIVKNGTYNETSKITLTVSGTAANPITLKAENVVTDVNTAKSVTINYSGTTSINTWNQGLIEGRSVNYWIVEGFKVTSPLESKTAIFNGSNRTLQIPKIWAGILFENSDNITVRYNHTFKTGISGIIFRPSSTGCSDLDSACGIQNQGAKVLSNKVEDTNQGWVNSSINEFIFEQEALTMWGVSGNFEVAYNRVINGTKEGIDIKLGRDGTIHDNRVQGVGAGISSIGLQPNGPGIYLDGRKEPMYNIKIYKNIVSNNASQGIRVSTERPLTSVANDVYNIQVHNNLVHGNASVGLVVGDRARDVNVYHNTFAQNLKGFIIKTYYPQSDPTTAPPATYPRDIVLRNNIFANDTGGGPSNILYATNITVDRNLGTYTTAAALYYLGANASVNTTNNSNSLVQVTSTLCSSPGGNPVKFSSLCSGSYFLALLAGSPAINQGSTTTGPAPTDYDGISRTAFGAPDMGAYEFH